MSVKKVLLLCGVPGSGKSYWAKNDFMYYPNRTAYVSRDEVRYSMITDNDEYFSKENAVFAEFVRRINAAIDDPEITSIIVDATHLNWASRNKILRKLHLSNVDVIPVVFNLPLKVCLERNEQREGRAKVPTNVICRMYSQYTDPSTDPFEYSDIIRYGGET